MVEPARTRNEPARPVCVLTTRDNVTADRVILELGTIGTEVFRLDLADFPREVRLDATLDGDRWTGTLHAHGRTVALGEIGAVWWWHPGRARAAEGLSPAEAEWAGREATAGLAGVLASLDCLHVNHPTATHASQSKADVLVQAPRKGLRVPPTWIGNTPRGALAFTTTHSTPTGTVCKSLVSPHIDHGDTHALFFTRTVQPRDMDHSIALTAHQLQRAVPKAFEVRLVVVGEEMFPARIDAHSEAARADFRADYAALTYRHITVPEPVRRGVLDLLAHYGLLYAALDLLVDDQDRWWLVDLNAAGQHDWLQSELPELAISAAIARLLSHPRNGKPHLPQ